MVNLKNITELPVAESADGLNLIVNDNGSAKQIAASAVGAQADFAVTDENSPAFIKNKPEVVQADWKEVDSSSPAFIKNKPSKELIYEWNFEASENPDDCVWAIIENVNDDLSWLTTLSEDTGWVIEVSQYGCYEFYDEESGASFSIVDPNVCATSSIIDRGYEISYQDGAALEAWCCSYCYDYLNNWNLSYFENRTNVCVYNKVYFDSDWNITEISSGGHLGIYSDEGGPLKSVKIYKVTR